MGAWYLKKKFFCTNWGAGKCAMKHLRLSFPSYSSTTLFCQWSQNQIHAHSTAVIMISTFPSRRLSELFFFKSECFIFFIWNKSILPMSLKCEMYFFFFYNELSQYIQLMLIWKKTFFFIWHLKNNHKELSPLFI